MTSTNLTLPPSPRHGRGGSFHDVIAPKLEDARKQVIRDRRRATICGALAAAILLLGSMAVIDYAWVIEWRMRAIWLAGVFGGILAGTIIASRWWIRRFRPSDVAAAVEQQRPEYGQRFRTALDYEDPFAAPAPALPQLVQALQTETVQVARVEDFEHVVDRRPLVSAVITLAAIVIFCAYGLLSGSEHRTAAGRALLLPWEYTQVRFSPESARVKQGDDVTLRIEIVGRPLASARVVYRPAGRDAEWQELPIDPPGNSADEKPAEFHGEVIATIEDCREDLDFLVLAGPRELPQGRIQVLQPLELESFQAEISPPSYLAREASKTDKLDMKVLEGSDVSFEFQLNRAPAEAHLVPVTARQRSANTQQDQQRTASLEISGNRLRGKLADLRQGITFDLNASSADGIELSSVRMAIRVQPDGKPRVRFINPPEELEVTPTTEVGLSIEASDDIGLQKVGIACQVANGPMHVLWEQSLGGGTEPIAATQMLALEKYNVTFQDGVTYYAFAEDHYFGEPRRTSTPLRFVDIRPYKRSYQMLDTGGT